MSEAKDRGSQRDTKAHSTNEPHHGRFRVVYTTVCERAGRREGVQLPASQRGYYEFVIMKTLLANLG